MNWREGALLREAVLNSLASAPRSLAIITIAAAAIGVLAFLELREAEDARSFQETYAAAGGYVAIVTGQGEPLDAGRCESLGRQTGVVAAGAVRGTGTVSFSSAPGVLFQSAAVTPGILAVWQPGMRPAPAPGGGAMIAGIALAQELGLREGSFAARTGESPIAVAAVLDSNRRNPQVQRWALEVAPPTGPADECWVEFDRNSYSAGTGRLGAWFATGSREPVVRPYFRRDEFTRDPAVDFAGRPGRFGWFVAGGLIAAILALSAWFRRAELGLYLALGTPRAQLWALLAIESAFLVTAATALAMLWALALQRGTHNPLPWDHAWVAIRSGLSGALLAVLLAPPLATLVARGNIAAMLKDR